MESAGTQKTGGDAERSEEGGSAATLLSSFWAGEIPGVFGVCGPPIEIGHGALLELT